MASCDGMSRPVSGSSMSSSSASWARARAMNTRCCCPPDSSPICRPENFAMPTCSRLSATRSQSPRPAWRSSPIFAHAAHHDHIGHTDREAPVDVGALGHVADADVAARAVAVDVRAAARGRQDAGDHLQQRALARTVGADDRDTLARPEVERDIVQRGRGAFVAHAHMIERDDGRVMLVRIVLSQQGSQGHTAHSTFNASTMVRSRRSASCSGSRARARPAAVTEWVSRSVTTLMPVSRANWSASCALAPASRKTAGAPVALT